MQPGDLLVAPVPVNRLVHAGARCCCCPGMRWPHRAPRSPLWSAPRSSP